MMMTSLTRMSPRGRFALWAGGAGLALACALVWQRTMLADALIADALETRGVRASYRVVDVGPRWERLADVVIGDPARPDLTARRIDVRVVTGWNGVKVARIEADGVVLRGAIRDGRVRLGDLEKLWRSDRRGGFTLPAIDVRLRDARALLATPWGDVTARVEGEGRLDNGFRGKVGVSSPLLTLSPCTARNATLSGTLSIRQRSIGFNGPVRAALIECHDVQLATPQVALTAALNERLDHWQGVAAPRLPSIIAARGRIDDVAGKVAFRGSRQRTTGTAELTARSGVVTGQRLRGLAADQSFQLSDDLTGGRGTVRVDAWQVDRRGAVAARRAAVAVRNTPVGAPLARIAKDLTRVTTARGEARTAWRLDADGLRGSVADASLVADTGATLRFGEGRGIRFGRDGMLADGTVRITGGGLPAATAILRRNASGQVTGRVTIAPITEGGSRVALAPLAVSAGSGGWSVRGAARLDGPLAGGRVTGLTLPIDVRGTRGGVAINPGCARVGFDSFTAATLRLERWAGDLCPAGGAVLARVAGGRVRGGVRLPALALRGSLGNGPLALSASGGDVDAQGRFALNAVRAVTGHPGRQARLAAARLDGQARRDGLAGRVQSLSGTIARVPLGIERMSGPWHYRGGVLTLTGEGVVRDLGDSMRFRPLVAPDLRMRLAGGVVGAQTRLVEPGTRRTVMHADVQHTLASGRGHAALRVADLSFDDALQPEALTPLTTGVVANVIGGIEGDGMVRWNALGVTSTGRFRTDGLDLAAAFGPVRRLRGEIVFDDLLGMTTGEQTLAIGEINPGLPVIDGTLRYRLLPGRRVGIAGARWPLAGGWLELEPTVIEMGQGAARRLPFRVVGMDAAKLIDTLQLENFAATGIFDGVLPMTFDQSGGRIDGGHLEAREPGGTLAYNGQVSNDRRLPATAKLAFDALKSLNYRNLSVDMDGPLDGEMITRLRFTGISNAPQQQTMLTRTLQKLPFRFNIALRGPMRALVQTARGFQDPSTLLRRLGGQEALKAAADIQAASSKEMP